MIWLLLVGIGALVGYELYAAITKREPTISQYVWMLSKRAPIVPFLFGYLMGHFFS